MGFFELFFIGVGLSMDAFAVSICKGLSMRKINYAYSAVIALFFGGFQAVMPLIGWTVGKQFEKYITNFDHWIAFALLLIIGGKMAYEAIFERQENNNNSEIAEKLNYKELFTLAVATSIDALAVGITFAFLKVNIWIAICIIGITTFILSFAGVLAGNKFGSIYKRKAEIAGGVVLILIGLKILLEHLGLISF